MSVRNVQLVFEQYQKARVNFAQAVAELALKAANVKCLESAGAIELLQPLLSDGFPSVRQCAAVAMARMCDHSPDVATQIVSRGMLPIIIDNLNRYSIYYKRSALYIFRSIAKHNADLAAEVVRSGALEHIVACLEDFDTQVKENAAWALGYISRGSEELATLVVDAGAVPLLVLCFQEPEISLKQIVAGAMVDVAQFRPEAVVDAGAVCHLVRGLQSQDPKLKRSVLAALGAVCGGGAALAEAVVAGGAAPPALLHLGHDCMPVRAAAACLVRDLVKHTVDLAQLIVNAGGCGPLVRLLGETSSNARTPACMALGFIAGQSDQLAMAVITSKAVPALVEVLQDGNASEAELCATAWALGHIGKHSPEHSEAIAVANAFPKLLQLFASPTATTELRSRACCTLKQALTCCLHRPALEPLLHSAPPQILKYVLGQYAKILPNDTRARRLFVTTGALRRIQEIQGAPGSSIREYVNVINSCFPEEIVKYYSPGYSETLLEKVEAYIPQITEIFVDQVPSECHSEYTDGGP